MSQHRHLATLSTHRLLGDRADSHLVRIQSSKSEMNSLVSEQVYSLTDLSWLFQKSFVACLTDINFIGEQKFSDFELLTMVQSLFLMLDKRLGNYAVRYSLCGDHRLLRPSGPKDRNEDNNDLDAHDCSRS